jgi:hypothetical protein
LCVSGSVIAVEAGAAYAAGATITATLSALALPITLGVLSVAAIVLGIKLLLPSYK